MNKTDQLSEQLCVAYQLHLWKWNLYNNIQICIHEWPRNTKKL